MELRKDSLILVHDGIGIEDIAQVLEIVDGDGDKEITLFFSETHSSTMTLECLEYVGFTVLVEKVDADASDIKTSIVTHALEIINILAKDSVRLRRGMQKLALS